MSSRSERYNAGQLSEARPVEAYKPGDPVHVFSFGRWYVGKVDKVGRSLVHVDYTTGTGRRRVKAFQPCLVVQSDRFGQD